MPIKKSILFTPFAFDFLVASAKTTAKLRIQNRIECGKYVAVEQLNHKHKSKWIAIRLLRATRIYKYRDQELSSRKMNFPVFPSFHLLPSFISLGTFGWIFFPFRPNGIAQRKPRSSSTENVANLLPCAHRYENTQRRECVLCTYKLYDFTHLFFLLSRRTRSSSFPTLFCPFPCFTLLRLFI